MGMRPAHILRDGIGRQRRETAAAVVMSGPEERMMMRLVMGRGGMTAP